MQAVVEYVFGNEPRDLVALEGLLRSFAQIRPDVVHAQTPKGGLLGVLAGRLAGVARSRGAIGAYSGGAQKGGPR